MIFEGAKHFLFILSQVFIIFQYENMFNICNYENVLNKTHIS